jgi:uncharacterized protein
MNIQSISLLIKPSTHLCNLDCSYCFYKRVSDVYPEGKPMKIEVAESIVKKTLDLGARLNTFTWQGGEPTLLGTDFYRAVCQLQDRYRKPGQIIENSLQTNGILIDEEWADFLKNRNFLVGLSLDGPREIHDHYRKTKAGEGTYAEVMNTARLLRERGVPFNILTLLTDANITDVDEIYNFLRKNRFTHLQFIPCFEHDPETGKPLPFSISGEELGRFYTRLFDLWMEDGFLEVSIRIFEDIFIYLIDGVKASCGWLERCGSYLLVEHNGDVYPCDFFVYPEWHLGNIVTDSLTAILQNPKRAAFGEMKAQLPDACTRCRFLSFCQGDCTKFRWKENDTYTNVSALCEARKRLLTHIEPHVESIRRRVMEIRAGRHQQNQKIDRNAPCPCGSGRKYKKCCGK